MCLLILLDLHLPSCPPHLKLSCPAHSWPLQSSFDVPAVQAAFEYVQVILSLLYSLLGFAIATFIAIIFLKNMVVSHQPKVFWFAMHAVKLLPAEQWNSVQPYVSLMFNYCTNSRSGMLYTDSSAIWASENQ